MLRSEESRWNPNNVLTNQENNTELLIDKRAALYTQKGAGKNNSKREKGKILGAKGQWKTITSLFGHDLPEVGGNEK